MRFWEECPRSGAAGSQGIGFAQPQQIRSFPKWLNYSASPRQQCARVPLLQIFSIYPFWWISGTFFGTENLNIQQNTGGIIKAIIFLQMITTLPNKVFYKAKQSKIPKLLFKYLLN